MVENALNYNEGMFRIRGGIVVQMLALTQYMAMSSSLWLPLLSRELNISLMRSLKLVLRYLF